MKIILQYVLFGLMISVIMGCSAAPPAQQDTPPEEIPAPVVQEVQSEPKQESAAEPIAQIQTTETPVESVPVEPVQEEPPAIPAAPEPVKKQEPPTEKKEVIEKKQPEPVSDSKQEIIAEFEGVTITKETYVQTKSEMEKVVDQLNHITATKDYNQWITFLSEEYKYEYSKPATLKLVSEALPVKGIKLKSLKDYFTYVFVPSRQKVRVDDIHFISPTQVEVIMKQGNVFLIIYSIENVSGSWKLIPPKL